MEAWAEMKMLLDTGMKMRQAEIPDMYLLKLKLMKLEKLEVQIMESEVQVDWVTKMEWMHTQCHPFLKGFVFSFL